ncbi:hypothetical protein B0T22DRAFT_472338 [Podospora appendiculata]|uniref:2EXR domain-containing protein n=1 Tax=Podospora appendiculata TaxID=314037 RepID=A0AAE0X1R9_9PEZI|nr:hypothetical protein B0T22DRAFT_472338 [Podospora appendiculata]
MTAASTFPLFPFLPAELRDQIWNDALPGNALPENFNIRTFLSVYRKGCWQPRQLTAAEPGFDAANDENNLTLEFRHELLGGLQFEIPLAFVNHEARHVALAWLRCLNEFGFELTMRARDSSADTCAPRDPVWARPFDLWWDALYIPADSWDDFLAEPVNRQFEPDLLERTVDVRPRIGSIAIWEALFRKEAENLAEILDYYGSLNTLYIVSDHEQLDEAEFPSADDGVRGEWWCEFEVDKLSYQLHFTQWNYNFEFVDNNKCEMTDEPHAMDLFRAVNGDFSAALCYANVKTFSIQKVKLLRGLRPQVLRYRGRSFVDWDCR